MLCADKAAVQETLRYYRTSLLRAPDDVARDVIRYAIAQSEYHLEHWKELHPKGAKPGVITDDDVREWRMK